MLIVLLGPSGCGKTRIEQELTARGIRRLRSHTTRARKPGEPADAYYFVSRTEFRQLPIVESILYKNQFFGLCESEVDSAQRADSVVTVTWAGAQQLKRLFPFAITVYLDCPFYQLEKRLPPELDQEKREKVLLQIEEDSRCASDCDYIVRNYDGELEAAVTEIMELYAKHKAHEAQHG